MQQLHSCDFVYASSFVCIAARIFGQMQFLCACLCSQEIPDDHRVRCAVQPPDVPHQVGWRAARVLWLSARGLSQLQQEAALIETMQS